MDYICWVLLDNNIIYSACEFFNILIYIYIFLYTNSHALSTQLEYIDMLYYTVCI